jgi:carbamoyltransferase
MNMLTSLKSLSQEENIVLVGGVGLNSVLNGKILDSKLFKNVYIPPAPGDEGIALGCALYGLQVSI